MLRREALVGYGRGFILALVFFLAIAPSSGAQSDAGALQKSAIARIDAYIDHFRKTGDLQSMRAELLQADAELTASNRIFAASGDGSALALGLTKQGHIYRMQGQAQNAIGLYTQALQAATAARNSTRQVDALSWRALAESNQRNIGAALADASEAVRLGQGIDDKDVFARALDVLGTVQLAQFDLAGAADSLNREVAMAASAKDPFSPYYAYLNRSDVYLKTAEKCDYELSFAPCYQALDRARGDLEEARKIAQKLGYTALEQQTQQFLGEVETRRALIRSQEGMHQTLQQKSAFHPKKLSDVLVTDKFVPAPGPIPPPLQQLYEASVREQKQFGAFADVAEARTWYTEGLMNEMRGNGDAALAAYLKAVDALEKDRRTLRDDKSRGTFLEDRIGFYYSPILQLLDRHRYDEAFQLFERSRSRALADLLASRTLGIRRPAEQKLYAESAMVRTQIADAQSRLFELASQANAASSPSRMAALQTQIGSLEEQDRQITARMTADAPRLRNLVSSTPATLAEVQASMRAGNYEILQYLVLQTAVIVWHITADTVTVRNVFRPRSELAGKVGTLQQSLSDRNAAFDQTTARELFLFLVAPVLQHVRSERLVIIPHEDLQYVPFQVLQNPADGRYLGERFQISYAPSATVLQSLKPSSGLAGGRLLALADPSITAAPVEVAAIAKLFPAKQKVVTDVLATKRDFASWAGAYDVIHLSVHGKFDASEPMLSYLLFAPDSGDGGHLTAAEMFGLPLDGSRLVVLSGCETGRVEATHANEILGMVRALLYAGAGTLVLSHWKVDSDATALWMQTFYESAQTKAGPEAARAALLRVKAVPAYQHPYYWAAFTMVGR